MNATPRENTSLDHFLAWNSKRPSLKVYVVVESSDLERSIDKISKAECPEGGRGEGDEEGYKNLLIRLSTRGYPHEPTQRLRRAALFPREEGGHHTGLVISWQATNGALKIALLQSGVS